MKFKIALAQCGHPEDGDVLALVERWETRAAAAGADLVVFPESLMTPYELPRENFIAAAEPLDGPFARGVRAIAAEHGLWTVFTANEATPDGRAPFNTAVACDGSGSVRGVYRKTHLFDADFTRESDRMSAGGTLFSPIGTPFGRVGLAICYDLRFPEVARHEALDGCELMVYPAAWVDGPGKTRQWRTLLEARAIENGMFVAGVSRCDAGYVGSSEVVAPDGAVLARAGAGEELLVCEIDAADSARVRSRVPSLANRRPELY